MKRVAQVLGLLVVGFISGLVTSFVFSLVIGLLSLAARNGSFAQLFIVIFANTVILISALALVRRRFKSTWLLASFTAGYLYLWVFSEFAANLFKISVKESVP